MTSTFRIGLAGLTASVFLVAAAPVRGAQELQVPDALKGPATLSGKVVDERGKGVLLPRLTLILLENKATLVAQGKNGGDFEVKGIKPGAYHLIVDQPDYATVIQDITVAEGKAPKLSVTSKRVSNAELLQKATQMVQAGQIPEARTEFLNVLQAHPELTGINRFLAASYAREKNTAEALKYLDAALVGNPNDNVMLRLAASSAFELNQIPKALGYLEKIDYITVADQDSDFYVNDAIALINGKHFAEARTILDRMTKLWPGKPMPYFYRAYANMSDQKPQDAKPDFQKYLELAPNGPLAGQAKDILATIK